MGGVLANLTAEVTESYNALLSMLPPTVQTFVSLFFLVLIVVLYTVFIWKFYIFVATKNIFGLNLNKYNRSNNPLTTKIIAGLLYFIEYIVVLPFIIFFWFGIFTLFMIIMTENLTVANLLIISTVIISAIRIASYYKEELARDIAKLIPFTLLGISLINPNFFNMERIIGQIDQLSVFFSDILLYLVFIIILEIVLRFFDFLISLFQLESIPKIEEKV